MINLLYTNSTFRTIVCGILILATCFLAFPLPSQADPITLIVVALVAATASAGVVVYDYFSCDINWIWGCGGGGGGGGNNGRGKGGQKSLFNMFSPATNNNTNTTSDPNSLPSGSITTPAPAPSIPSNAFYADPSRVRKSTITTLHWGNVVNATTCAISGGDLSLTGLGIEGTQETGAIEAQTVYTLTCTGAGGTASLSTLVTLVPVFEEI